MSPDSEMLGAVTARPRFKWGELTGRGLLWGLANQAYAAGLLPNSISCKQSNLSVFSHLGSEYGWTHAAGDEKSCGVGAILQVPAGPNAGAKQRRQRSVANLRFNPSGDPSFAGNILRQHRTSPLSRNEIIF